MAATFKSLLLVVAVVAAVTVEMVVAAVSFDTDLQLVLGCLQLEQNLRSK
jgi:hypothetical protein